MSENAKKTELQTVTIDGSTYDLAGLPQEVIALLSLFQTWSAELATQRSAVSKSELALRALTAEVKAKVEASGVQPVNVEAPV